MNVALLVAAGTQLLLLLAWRALLLRRRPRPPPPSPSSPRAFAAPPSPPPRAFAAPPPPSPPPPSPTVAFAAPPPLPRSRCVAWDHADLAPLVAATPSPPSLDVRVAELARRVAALRAFATASWPFAFVSGAYVGKTTNPANRFRSHVRTKASASASATAEEAVLMVVLARFECELEALRIERILTDALWCVGVPRFERPGYQPFGGKGRVRGHGPAWVYALVVVGRAPFEHQPDPAPRSPPRPAHPTATVGTRAASASKTPPSYVTKRGRPPTRTTETMTFARRVRDMCARGHASPRDAFWSPWPAELGDATDLDARVTAFHSFIQRLFARVVGVYVGKTVLPCARFDSHLHSRELQHDETLVMVLLAAFDTQSDALHAERLLTDRLMALGIKRYEREEPFGGKGGVARVDAAAYVYAAAIASGPRAPQPNGDAERTA